jgi:hypothetical protein
LDLKRYKTDTKWPKVVTMEFEDFVNQSIENRAGFLAAYKKIFNSLDPKKDRRKRAEIVIELLQLEMDHLNEDWIRAEVIRWHSQGNQQYLDRAFRVPTVKQKSAPIRDAMVHSRVSALAKSGLSIRKASEKLAADLYQRNGKFAFMWDTSDPDFDLSVAIRNAYNKHKERLKNDLPRPYFGSDISAKPHET